MIQYPIHFSKYQELNLYQVKQITNHGEQQHLIRQSKGTLQAYWKIISSISKSLRSLYKTKNINTMEATIIC